MPTTICFDFGILLNRVPSGTPVALPFSMVGWNFTGAPVGMQAILMNSPSLGRGLEFPASFFIDLPVPSAKINMIIGQGGGPITVQFKDAALVPIAGGVVTNSPGASMGYGFRLRRRAKRVTFTGGSNEGVLIELCITFS